MVSGLESRQYGQAVVLLEVYNAISVQDMDRLIAEISTISPVIVCDHSMQSLQKNMGREQGALSPHLLEIILENRVDPPYIVIDQLRNGTLVSLWGAIYDGPSQDAWFLENSGNCMNDSFSDADMLLTVSEFQKEVNAGGDGITTGLTEVRPVKHSSMHDHDELLTVIRRMSQFY
ncbi:hypothetical protein DMZ48_14880 [Robertkochia solimangrovi]|nr:hypothetical protein DMZ48_14880 [Robertkochia solimangrovi]